MSKILLFIVPLFLVSLSYSQEKELQGKIANTEAIGGIVIQNKTHPNFAVTHEDGTFKIKATVNDSLSLSGAAYEPKTIAVSQKEFDQAALIITLEEKMNELEAVDLGKTMSQEERETQKRVEDNLNSSLTWEKMEFEYEFRQDKNSSIGGNKASEAFHNGQQLNDGVKLQVIIPAIIKFLKKKQPEDTSTLPEDAVRYYIKQRYSKEELLTYFNIPTKNAEDFLYFLVEDGVPDIFLQESNELELTQLIDEKAALYNARAKE